MSDETLGKLVSGFMATSQPQYAFGWQGGEPTLMGTGFFQRVIALQKKFGRAGASVANGLQTNATLITDDMAALFAAYNFLLGVSLDGPPVIHDKYRRTGAGAGSHQDVLRGIECLKRNKVEFNILVLVSRANVKEAATVYRYLRDSGFLFHQYIPCVEFDNDGNLMPYAITGEDWGDFLCGLYDAWVGADTRIVSIRLFDSILSKLVDNCTTVCHMGGNCCQYFMVEHNGDVYPCDFFADPKLLLGNIAEMSWQELADSSVYRQFGARKSSWNEECGRCEFKTLCMGDCPKHRYHAGTDSHALSWLCEGWKQFYAHSIPGFKRLARRVEKERIASASAQTPGTVAPGRNDPCPCGSGRKYKHCCLIR